MGTRRTYGVGGAAYVRKSWSELTGVFRAVDCEEGLICWTTSCSKANPQRLMPFRIP